jgi:hypothetical protein
MSAMENEKIKEIGTEEEFNELLKLPNAILYLQVDWSGPERVSRSIVAKALKEIGVFELPVFKINVSEPTSFAERWCLEQRNVQPYFIYSGWGETVLLEHGKITDFITYPAHVGYEKTKEKIKSWAKPGG